MTSKLLIAISITLKVMFCSRTKAKHDMRIFLVLSFRLGTLKLFRGLRTVARIGNIEISDNNYQRGLLHPFCELRNKTSAALKIHKNLSVTRSNFDYRKFLFCSGTKENMACKFSSVSLPLRHVETFSRFKNLAKNRQYRDTER